MENFIAFDISSSLVDTVLSNEEQLFWCLCWKSRKKIWISNFQPYFLKCNAESNQNLLKSPKLSDMIKNTNNKRCTMYSFGKISIVLVFEINCIILIFFVPYDFYTNFDKKGRGQGNNLKCNLLYLVVMKKCKLSYYLHWTLNK